MSSTKKQLKANINPPFTALLLIYTTSITRVLFPIRIIFKHISRYRKMRRNFCVFAAGLTTCLKPQSSSIYRTGSGRCASSHPQTRGPFVQQIVKGRRADKQRCMNVRSDLDFISETSMLFAVAPSNCFGLHQQHISIRKMGTSLL